MTDQEYIDLIITTIGGDTADGLLASTLPIFWGLYPTVTDPNVKAQLVKLNGIDLLLGQTWRKVDFKALDGASVNLSDMFDHLLAMRGAAQGAIDATAGALGAAGAVGELLATAPIAPPWCIGPDANDRAYRGDAYRSRKRRGAL